MRVLLILLLSLPAVLKGQHPGVDFPDWHKKIVLDFQEAPLRNVLESLEDHFDVRFSYVDELVKPCYVSVSAEADGLLGALELVLSKTPLGFEPIDRNNVVLFKAPTSNKIRKDGPIQKKGMEAEPLGSIQGFVYDSETGKPVPYANVILMKTTMGGSSDPEGRFEVKYIPWGKYRLKVNSIGYRPIIRNLVVNRESVWLGEFLLNPENLEADSVVITGERETWKIVDRSLRLQPSTRILDQQMIESVPVVLEPDLFWMLQSLPGVSSPNDLSSELYVRGGSPDQNLITLDRATVYQPNHLFGIAGIFNTDMIDWVHFSSGGFSAQYGNRLSSVVDVRTSSNSSQSFKGSGNISLLSSKLTLEGTANDRWYYLISGRRTYLDKATELWKSLGQIRQSVPYHFHDVMAKLSFRPNRKHTVAAWALYSKDAFDVRTGAIAGDIEIDDNQPYYYSNVTGMNLHWDNRVLTASWEFLDGDAFGSRLTAFGSNAGNDLEFSGKYVLETAAPDSVKEFVDALNANRFSPADVNNQINDLTVRWDGELQVAENHLLLIGSELNWINLDYSWDFGEGEGGNATGAEPVQVFFDYFPVRFDYQRKVTNLSFYVEDLWQVNEQWGFKPGVRFERFGNSGPDLAVSPRFSVRYDRSSNLAFKAAAGIYYQSLFRSRERGFIGFLEIPFSTAETKLQRSFHLVGGAEYFFDDQRKMTVDVYYKTFSKMVRNHGSSETLPDFALGSGRAYGIEIDFKARGDKLSYELAYVLAWATRRFDNGSYNTNFDQRHNLSFMGRYHFSHGWELDFRWIFRSGTPFTPTQYATRDVFYDAVSGSLVDTGNNQELSEERAGTVPLDNPARFPFYHRLDIALSRVFVFQKWQMQPYLSLINSYYKTNPFYYYYANGRLKAVGLPVVPTLGVRFEF